MDSASYRYSRVWFENVIFPTSTLPVFKKRASYASCSLYYEYELSYADGEKSSRGTTYAIELERENGEWRINNISTNSELEELVEDAPDVQMLFEDESTPVSNPDIERAHQQAEVLAEQADVERTERAAYTFHG